ncbi:MG2 domain-containing protein [Hymenobacter aerilatus]|uniref:MG2 domain-containing protein n=1 Tax=Hymenobacter aerilatus TaxID=2932251 RepID=A0A8T9SX57_9BACT|nr:alpha-2-macroglobulin family protein [Hymenobacter aerilatus]UOR05534.1 MG2 domain-containing protein [Hymenobacter aerilatus]
MRYFLLLTLGLLLMFTAGSSTLTSLPDGPNPKRWKQIDALLKKDQTASAGKLVEEIYQQARRQQDTPEYLRALLYKLRLLEEKEEDADEKAIALIEKDLRTATFPGRPILHSLLAQLYTRYYQQHRYQLYDRTPGAAQANDSLATWDAAHLGAAIVKHYQASIADESQRQQQLQLARLGYAIRGGDAEGRALRPTLYDLLAHRALAGLGNDEFYVTRPAEQFELKNSALFGPAADFARLPLQAPPADSLNGQFHALRVWQQLTQFRLTDTKNPAALADVDLQRLRFVWQHATFADKGSLYRTALLRGAETYRALPISTEFLVAAADNLEESQPTQARKLALQAEKQFPKSRGGQLARALRQRIEQVTVGFTTEEVVLPNQPWLLKLDVRNTQRLYATAYRVSSAYNLRLTEPNDSDEGFNFQKTFARALASKPAATWTLDLPTPADYRAHTVQHAGPALPLGHYIILLSTAPENPAQKRSGVVTTHAYLSVSELSQVHRNTASGMEVLVLHRQIGEALPGVRVLPLFQYYSQKEEAYKQRRGAPLLTGTEGAAQISMGMKTGDNSQIHGVFLTRGTDSLLVENLNGYFQPRRANTREAEKPQRRTFLYTDRAIYRPGQTLYFKGILTESRAGINHLLTGQPVTVRLRDVNGQTVQTLNFTTSDFGSFHGSVVLPTGLLNGEMALETDHGSVGFAVEDYKRPTFQVTFAPVQGTPVLGQQVAVRGTATAYAGQAIDGATVQYRVVRRTVWPLFGRGYGRPIYPGGGEDVEISNGTAQTDSAGGFVVTFTAKGEAPGSNHRGPWQPGYVFTITADVTDAAGETRTGEQTLSLGTNALTLRLEVPELLNREDLPTIQLLSTNATGEALAARGTLRLYRLTSPTRALRPRAWERPEREALSREEFKQKFPLDAYAQEDNDSTWARTLVATQEFTTEQSPLLPALAAELARQQPGRYLLQATATPTTEAKAAAATTEQFFTLFSAQSAALPVPTLDWFVPLQDSVAPGQPVRFLVGSSEAGARILLEAEAKGETLRHEWLALPAGGQRVVEVPTTAALEGAPLYLHLTQVRDNRLYQHNATVQVVTPPAPLRISLATFRDKLQPGQKETWRVTIHNADGKPAKAELLASLYDKSLDVFRMHSFMELDFPKPYYQAVLAWNGRFGTTNGSELFEDREEVSDAPALFYPHLTWWGYSLGDEESANDYLLAPRNGKVKFTPPVVKRDKEVMRIASGAQTMSLGVARGTAAESSIPPPPVVSAPRVMADSQELNRMVTVGYGTPKQPAPDLSTVPTRSDFRETAFWLPDLRTNDKGKTVLEFQMPEAVTRWQLLTLAHDQQLHTSMLTRTLVTQKQLQVTTNAPRFFRQGDQLTLSAKISNLNAQATSGNAQLFLLDARTQQPLKELIVSQAQQPFSLNGNASTALNWNIIIPETAEGQVPLEAITYRVVAQGEVKIERKARKRAKSQQIVSDGEENTLPVLPNRLLITESLSLPIAGAGTKTFDLQKLTSTTSPTRRNYSLTLEMTQNPAWYAVQALPYLMEYPYECSEQVFSRLYANLLAASILKQNPRIKPVLAEWQRAAQSGDKQALTSKLEQNQELKALLLQETPWVRDAQTDTERMRRLAELFDEPRLQAETTRALAKLAQMQLPDGAFPWFEQMPADRYITQLVVAGFGKLRKLNAFDATQNPQAQQVLSQALAYLDGQLQRDYTDLHKQKNVNLKENHLSPTQVQALYARSFWSKPVVANAVQPAATYYQSQLATYWPQQNRYLQGLAALTLHRTGNLKTAQQVMTALTENALHSPELGMYWKDVRAGYYWQQAPTETQAALIEAYDEVAQNQQAVDEMKLWLLKQKQTRNWESTRATADACYALLLRGSDWLTPTQPIQVTVGGEPVTPNKLEAGTGYFKNTWLGTEVKPAQGRVSVTKLDAGVAWGALYWQYFEQVDKITSAATGLQLTRQLFREQRTAGGPVLEPLTAATPLRVGDVLVVRLVLRSDRDLEYVHLKDQRAAGLELINQISGYQYQSGLGYYENPRDAATNFFISYFPKGTHTFEYRLRAAQAGNFSGGLSQLQCLYAPEFSAHSAGQRVQITAQR